MAKHRFIGDRAAPTPLGSIRRLRPAPGHGTMPAALRAMAGVRTLYAESASAARPELEVSALDPAPGHAGHHAGPHLWRVDVPVGGALRGARPGRTAERRPAEHFLAEVDEAVSFTSHRPEWIPTLPTPLARRPERPWLRRLDGTRVRPLWVYDSARHAFDNDAWPLGLVGRIFNSEGYSGTGTIIGDRLVATAGHMVPWGQSGWWMQFVPAYFNGSSLFGAGVESYVSDARGYNTGGNVTGYDWAILRLYEPLGASLGYFGYNSYSSDWNDLPVWSNIGYPGDIDNAQEPAFQQGFTINDTDGDSNGGEELESENCDLNHGNSGGPIYAWWNNGTDPRIVGVVSGEETEYKFPFSSRNDNVFAAGDGFVNLCAWGRSNWPA